MGAAFAQGMENFSNGYFDFNYNADWKFIEPSLSNAISDGKAVAFESNDGKALAVISVLDGKDYETLGNIGNVPDLKVSKTEDSELFGIPAKKYFFTTDIEGLATTGEVTISQVKDGYFYKLMLMGETANYPSFDIESSGSADSGNQATENNFGQNGSTETGQQENEGDGTNILTGIIDWIMSIFKWLLSLIGLK